MRILIIQTGFIGDVILSTPVYSYARELFPDAEIDLLTTKVASTLFESDLRFKNVFIFDKRGADSGIIGFFKMLKKIRSQKYDNIISLHKSIRTTVLTFLSGAKTTYGFKQASMDFLYTKSAERKDLKHEALRNLAIFRAMGKEPEQISRPLKLYYSEKVKERVDSFLEGLSEPVVGIAPGSVWATKRWTKEGFNKTSKFLSAKGYRVLIIGGKEDSDLANIIAAGVERVENLCGKFSLSESAYLISKLNFLISNDSSPLHMASAAQTPVVALFCATVPEFGFGPWMVKNTVLGVNGLTCRPCGRHGGQTCPTGTHYCQTKLESSIVCDAILSLEKELANGNNNRRQL